MPVIQSPSSKSSPFKSKSKSLAFESKSSPSPQEIGLESDLSPSPGLESYNSAMNINIKVHKICNIKYSTASSRGNSSRTGVSIIYLNQVIQVISADAVNSDCS